MRTAPIAMLALLAAAPPPSPAAPYEPTWESLQKHEDPEWFRDAKFGIYTHWGPITAATDGAPADMEWYGRQLYDPKHKAFQYHREKFGDQKTVGYKDVIPRFTAERFDPEAWADLFARAGARFAGPVAVHHDNFAMWDSAVTRWNSRAMGPKRDITGELAKAIRAKGLKFLTTFHHGFAWRYFEPAYAYDAADPKDADLYGEPHAPKAPPSPRFLDTWLAMVNEVLRKYEPDLIWFDFERGREDRLTDYPWLTDTAVGPWFHHECLPFKTVDDLVDVLVDIVSKNGCMLLNVGPRPTARSPSRAGCSSSASATG